MQLTPLTFFLQPLTWPAAAVAVGVTATILSTDGTSKMRGRILSFVYKCGTFYFGGRLSNTSRSIKWNTSVLDLGRKFKINGFFSWGRQIGLYIFRLNNLVSVGLNNLKILFGSKESAAWSSNELNYLTSRFRSRASALYYGSGLITYFTNSFFKNRCIKIPDCESSFFIKGIWKVKKSFLIRGFNDS